MLLMQMTFKLERNCSSCTLSMGLHYVQECLDELIQGSLISLAINFARCPFCVCIISTLGKSGTHHCRLGFFSFALIQNKICKHSHYCGYCKGVRCKSGYMGSVYIIVYIYMPPLCIKYFLVQFITSFWSIKKASGMLMHENIVFVINKRVQSFWVVVFFTSLHTLKIMKCQIF